MNFIDTYSSSSESKVSISPKITNLAKQYIVKKAKKEIIMLTVEIP